MENRKSKKRGQSAIEYIILSTAIVIVVLVGFDEKKGFLIQARNLAEGMFNQALRGIMGTAVGTAGRSTVDQQSPAGFEYP